MWTAHTYTHAHNTHAHDTHIGLQPRLDITASRNSRSYGPRTPQAERRVAVMAHITATCMWQVASISSVGCVVDSCDGATPPPPPTAAVTSPPPGPPLGTCQGRARDAAAPCARTTRRHPGGGGCILGCVGTDEGGVVAGVLLVAAADVIPSRSRQCVRTRCGLCVARGWAAAVAV